MNADEELARRLQAEEYELAANEREHRRAAAWEYWQNVRAPAAPGPLPGFQPLPPLQPLQPLPPPAAPRRAPRPAAPPRPRPAAHTCTACADTITGTAYRGGCEHVYCRGCLIHMATTSLSGTTTFPVSCCNQKFSDPLIISILTGEQRDRYSQRLEESQTTNPIYCPNPACARLVREVDGYGCRRCRTRVCATCRRERHHGACAAPDSPGDRELERQAAREGWKRCPRCTRHVEKMRGTCNKIDCVCGERFCYQCGAAYTPDRTDKTCACPLWHPAEMRDVLAANPPPQFGAVPPAPPPPPQVPWPQQHHHHHPHAYWPQQQQQQLQHHAHWQVQVQQQQVAGRGPGPQLGLPRYLTLRMAGEMPGGVVVGEGGRVEIRREAGRGVGAPHGGAPPPPDGQQGQAQWPPGWRGEGWAWW